MLALFSGCKEQIIHDLSEHNANRLLTTLHAQQISVEKVKQPDGNWAIAVDRARALDAIKVIDATRLLRDLSEVKREKPALLASREDQRFRYERALSSEIEASMTSLPGVLEARVHLNLPLTDPLFGRPISDHQIGSASVLVIVSKEFGLEKEDLAAVVAGAAGLEPSTIAVLISGGNNRSQQESLKTSTEIPADQQIAFESVSSKSNLRILPKIDNWMLIYSAIALLVVGVFLLLFGIKARANRSLWN